MSKDPAFLFYSSDFLTGVSDLTFEERGQYITLLCLQHQKGRLSKKAIQIAVPNATADVLLKFKKDEHGLFFNERLELEANKRAQHAEKQRQRAIDGWKKRKKGQSHGNTMVNAAALPLESENENENEKFNFKIELLNLGAENDIVTDWLKVRKNKKATNTKTALNGFIKQVQKSNLPLNQVIKLCVENSWSGFKAEWLSSKENTQSIMSKLSQI